MDLPGGLWAGVGEVDITPTLGTDLAGSFVPRPADRIERRLAVKATALISRTSADSRTSASVEGDPTGQSLGTAVLLISCDLVMVSEDLVERASRGITERTGIPSSHILISATHSHNTPSTVPALGVCHIAPDQYERTVAAVTEAGVTALTTLVPARIGYGQAPVNGVCFNRRHRRTDGLVETNPGRGRDDLDGPAGPTDPLVTGIIVEHRDGRPLAWWSNLSLHYVGADSGTAISSDYYGAVAERLRQFVGSPVHVQATNGCSGDINTIDLADAVPEQGVARAELVATAVAGAVLAATMMAPRQTDLVLAAVQTSVELERAEVTDMDLTVAAAYRAGDRDDLRLSFVHGVPITGQAADYFAERLPHLAARPRREEAMISVLTIGQLCLVGLPGEIFVEHGLAIRDRSGHELTAVVGLAGGHVGYVPTSRAWVEGGYETWRNALSWTAPGSGERLVDAAGQISSGGGHR